MGSHVLHWGGEGLFSKTARSAAIGWSIAMRSGSRFDGRPFFIGVPVRRARITQL